MAKNIIEKIKINSTEYNIVDTNAVKITAQSLTDEQKAQARANIGADKSDSLPDYWESHLSNKIATIRNRQKAAGKDCYSFVAMADFHHPSNADYSPKLIKRIADACNIKYCLCLGDIQTGAAVESKDDVVTGWEEIHNIFAPIRGMTLFTAGNHDGAYGRYDANGDGTVSGVDEFYVYNYTREEIYDTIFRQVSLIPGVVFNNTGDGYYVDDTTHKVRYLLLNSHWAVYEEGDDGTAVNNFMRKCRFGQSQQDFAIEALQSIPDDNWTVVVGCHMPICAFPGDGGGGDLSLFREVLIAYQNRSAYSGTYGIVGNYDYVSVNVNFSNAVGRVVGAFSGHMHNDLLNTDYAFPIITIASDNYTSFKDIEGGGITAAGELGTVTEQAFDVMTVNKRDGVIYATRIGKGTDRVIPISGACVITLNMDNSTASNTVETVQKGSAYTNTITPKTGYTLSSVTVTMGGVDITSTAYSNGVIMIDEVTGNIVITALTSQLYANLADPTSEDWSNDAYLADGVFTDGEGYHNGYAIVTNFIPVTQYDILRFKGFDLEAGVNGSAPHIALYDADKNYLTKIKTPTANKGTSAGFPTSVVTDDNGVTTYEIVVRGDTNEQYTYKNIATNTKYVRFCALRIVPENEIVITVNEEIVEPEESTSPCIITLNLDNAVVSNDNQSISKNSAYTNTITPKTGYTLSSVTVTMGGVDITSTAYSNGMITITDVTGDIVITAVATAISTGYTNLADPTSEDWSAHMSHTSSGVFVADDNDGYVGKVLTNFIPITQYDILRFKGFDMENKYSDTASLGTEPTMFFYDADKVHVCALKLTTDYRGKSNGLPTSVTTDENGVTAYEILIRGDTNEQYVYKDNATRAKYVRFYALRTVPEDEIIITVNEEIV